MSSKKYHQKLVIFINADDAKKFLIEKKDCRNTFKTVSRMFDNMTFKNVKKMHNDTEEKSVEKKDEKKSSGELIPA